MLKFTRIAFTHLIDMGITISIVYKLFLIIEISEKNNKNGMIGYVLLTNSGYELARICNPKPVDGFLDYVLENWKAQGLKVNIIN